MEFLELPIVSELPADKQEAALRLYEDGVLEGGLMELVDLFVEDMDENGQLDCVAMLRNAGEEYSLWDSYGHGCVYIYLNDREPYRFYDENWPYLIISPYIQWADLTGDGRLEIILETQGTGNGAWGDWYVAVVSDTGEGIRELEFPPIPAEMAEEPMPGILVEVYMEAEEDTYSAYCPYLEDRIMFQAPWTDYGRSMEITGPTLVGGNVRGFAVQQLLCDETDGKNKLVVAEYLSGEGGVVDEVGTAFFTIAWDEDGASRIEDWWVEPVN